MGDGGGHKGVHGFVDGYASAAAEGEAVGGVEEQEDEEVYLLDIAMVFLLEAGVFFWRLGSYYDLFHKGVMGVEDSASQARKLWVVNAVPLLSGQILVDFSDHRFSWSIVYS